MNCTPCRVKIEGKWYEVSRDGTVRETWVNETYRHHGEPLPAEQAQAIRHEASRRRRNANARERSDALRSLGMKRCANGTWE